MDEPLKPRLHPLALCLAALLAAPLQAQESGLRDPTRPPASLRAPPAGSAAPVVASAPQLQSVLIARHPGGRHVAVIDGQTLRLGERYKGAVVASMSETEVVLVQGKQRQVLKLFAAPATPK